MRNARPAARPRFVLALILLLLGGLNSGLNAAPAGDAPPAPPPTAVPAIPPVLLGKIAHIRIFGSKNIRADTIQALLTQKVGDFYSPAAAAKDQTAIAGMGFFRDPVVLNAAPSPAGGVDLNYTVTENPVVTAIRFTANTPTKEPTIPAGTLLVQMKTRVGQVLNTKILVSDLDALVNHDTGYVSKQGYLFDISTDINIDPATGVLTIPLVEAHVQSIQITGNSRIKTADILAHMHTKPGDLYDDKVLLKDLGAIYEMGDFKEIQNWTFTEPGPGQLVVTIPVVEREAATVDKLDEKQGKTIPFLYDPVTVAGPVIQVSVNGKPPLPFLVDTGTDAPLSIDLWAAARLGLEKGLKKQDLIEKGNGFKFKTIPIQSAVFQGMNHVNDVTFNINQAQINDLSFLSEAFIGQRIAGIVGLGMLSQLTTRFDFVAKTLTVFVYPHPPLRLSGATVLPLRLTSDELFTAHVKFTTDVVADLILDTGSTSTQVPLAMAGALYPTAAAYGTLTEAVGNLYVCPDLRLPGLKLGPLWVPDVVAGTLPLERTSLGMDILAGYRLTLDGPNAQLSLESSARGRYVQGWSGLDLTQTGLGWAIRELLGGSPARKAGVRVGDEIAAVNGRSVRGLSGLQVRALTAGLSGTPLRASLRRGGATRGKTLEVSWIPLDNFNAPRSALDGLTMRKPNGGPWIILNVLKGSPGGQMGLQAGDEITQMNGAPVADMPLNQIMKIMSGAAKSITFTVTRTGRPAPLSVKLVAPPPAPVAP